MATREQQDSVERGPTPEELAEEIRLWTLYQQQQDDRRWRAQWRRGLSTPNEPRVA